MNESKPLYIRYTILMQQPRNSYLLKFKCTSKAKLRRRILDDYNFYDVESHRIVLMQPIFASDDTLIEYTA